jgi:hypothetical protein
MTQKLEGANWQLQDAQNQLKQNVDKTKQAASEQVVQAQHQLKLEQQKYTRDIDKLKHEHQVQIK